MEEETILRTGKNTLRFILDGRIVEPFAAGIDALSPTTTVLNYLRSLPGHKGTREGCAEGDCGACTVVIAQPGAYGRMIYRAVDSCLLFLPMLHGKQLITVENLAAGRHSGKVLHPVQQWLMNTGGSQCGYCTPGVIMSLFGLFKNHTDPDRTDIEEALTGNLCRCTGYQPILDAAKQLGRETRDDHFASEENAVREVLSTLRTDRSTLEIIVAGQAYYKPFGIDEALRLRRDHPDAVVTAGSTDLALRVTKQHELIPEIIDISDVEELRFFREEDGKYHIGSGLPMEQVRKSVKDKLPALFKLLGLFGSLQIRNMATLGGNLGSASPIGDTIPLLMAYRALVKVRSTAAEREIPIEQFITGYRKNALLPGELITGVVIPVPDPCEIIDFIKISKRRNLDISTVSAGFRLKKHDTIVEDLILAYGGMAATPKRASQTEKFLIGRECAESNIREGMDILEKEFSPISDARSGAKYRRLVAPNLLLRFFDSQAGGPCRGGGTLSGWGDPVRVGGPRQGGGTPSGWGDEKHFTGESVFTGDIVAGSRQLSGTVVYSRHSHARILSIDKSEAIKVSGVHCILTAQDIPGENQMGPVVPDEPCLADGEVTFCGQAVALIAAESQEAAREAEKKLLIRYDPLPAVLDIEQSMEAGTLLAPPRRIIRGHPTEILEKSPHVICGELTTGAQEHWYLETQAALAIPGEGKEILVCASSQNPSETQAIVAEVLGLPKNEVEVEVRRIGGGFGGKETQGNHVAAWASLIAHTTGHPVMIRLFRDDDQIMTGKRHRFISRYEAGFDDAGRILALTVDLNSDAGAATDLSRAILERAMLHADNAYFIPDISVTGKAWKTNLPPNTAFRGFGGPQGMAVIENVIDRIARFLRKDAAEVRRLNFYTDAPCDITPYGEKVENNHLQRIFERLMKTSGYHSRRKDADEFNRQHRYMKKGMALTPVKFGISFTTSYLNQAGALVNLYTDGTVLVNHGGTEMGQGLHTKILQIASAELGVSPDRVRVNATNTSRVPNTSPTAASSGSDLNGMAVKQAVDILKSRLGGVFAEEVLKRMPDAIFEEDNIIFSGNEVFDKTVPLLRMPFAELCNLARIKQVSLSATGFYKTPGIWFDREKGVGNPFFYFAYGMAVSEVLVDVLTGQQWLVRTDILHDAGEPVNAAIDRGQIEGGFIQGMGWCTTEEIKWDNEGRLLTHSPDTYKIPTINDIPADFRVELLDNAANPGTIRGSKAVGEPPFMLGLSVWLAIKDAISSVNNHETEPELPIPATAEQVLLCIEKLRNQ